MSIVTIGTAISHRSIVFKSAFLNIKHFFLPSYDSVFLSLSAVKNVKQKVEQCQALIEELPTPNRLLLSWMIVHMTHVISKVSNSNQEVLGYFQLLILLPLLSL